MSKISIQGTRERLSAREISEGSILLDGLHIGRFVRYGRFSRQGSAIA